MTGLSSEEAARRSVVAVRRMNREMNIPFSLAEFGVTEDAIEQMAADALQGQPRVTNPCIATKEDVISIYHQALWGEEIDQ